MNSNQLQKIILLLVILFLPFFISVRPAAADPGPGKEPLDLRGKTVGLMPFMQVDYAGVVVTNMEAPLICPLSGLCININDSTSLTEKRLTGYLQDALAVRLRENLLPRAEVDEAFKEQFVSNDDTPLAIANSLGNDLRADYIVLAILWEYEERVGKSYGAESPASVSFTVFLVDIARGEQVWKGHFAMKQKALTDNVLRAKEFFKGGAKWHTADELARQGIERILADSPF